MPRPPLPIGTYGSISVRVDKSGSYIAKVRFRDADGVTRAVERAGRTATIARNKLLIVLSERTGPNTGSGLSGESTFKEAATLWLATIEEGADTGELSETPRSCTGCSSGITSCRRSVHSGSAR
jgi:hypothetical protein